MMEELPAEMLSAIAEYLPVKDIFSIPQLNRHCALVSQQREYQIPLKRRAHRHLLQNCRWISKFSDDPKFNDLNYVNMVRYSELLRVYFKENPKWSGQRTSSFERMIVKLIRNDYKDIFYFVIKYAIGRLCQPKFSKERYAYFYRVNIFREVFQRVVNIKSLDTYYTDLFIQEFYNGDRQKQLELLMNTETGFENLKHTGVMLTKRNLREVLLVCSDENIKDIFEKSLYRSNHCRGALKYLEFGHYDRFIHIIQYAARSWDTMFPNKYGRYLSSLI